MDLETYIAAWDPYKVVEFGINNDEYSQDVKDIKQQFRDTMKDKDVGELVHSVFAENFAQAYPGLKDECLRRGGAIKRLLVKK